MCNNSKDKAFEKRVKDNLTYLGEDISRPGLRETPKRVRKAWQDLLSGYRQNPKDYLKDFAIEKPYHGMILLRDCEYVSVCEHHLLPFFGLVNIAYIPGSRVLGVSKLARLVDTYTRRLQVQERIGQQIVDFLVEEAGVKAAACMIEGRHMCMMARGVEKQNPVMVTSSVRGAMADNASTKAELMAAVQLRGSYIR